MLKNRNVLLFISLLFLIFWTFFLPGPRVANDFPFASQESVKEGFNLPQIWSSRGNGLGGYGASTLWAWPTDFLYGFGGWLGINFSILERLLGFFPILILGAWSILRLLKYYKVGEWGRLIAVLVYLLNTYILLLIDGGQFSIGLAYAFLPFAFLTVVESIDSKLRQKLVAAVAISILGIFDIRFIYVLAILLLIYFLYNLFLSPPKKWKAWILDWLKVGLVISFIYLGLNFYWILPALLAKTPSLPMTYTRTSQTSFLNFTQLKHSVSLLQPHWYKNVFGKTPPFRKEFLLIPMLAFLAPILKRKDKQVWFWTIVAVISVFLAKGANPPFPQVYPWLFTHVPGFSLFRDSTKFFFLVALSYSVLIAFTVSALTKRFPRLKFVLPLFLMSYFVYLASPVWLGKMTGIFSQPRYQEEYFALADKFEKDRDFGRVFWIPSKAPLGFSSPTHPALEANRLESLRPFAAGTVGTYETQNFLREARYVGQVFDVLGVKYLIYPYPDTRREDLDAEKIEYYHTFLGQLSGLSWVESVTNFGTDREPIPLLKTKHNQAHFFVTESTWMVLGSDAIYRELASFPRFVLSKNAFLFLEEKPTLGENSDALDFAKIILYGKTETDLLASFLKQGDFIFPASNLDFSPNPSASSGQAGWWKRETSDLVWWRDFLQQKYGIDNTDFDYGGGYAIAEGNRGLKMETEKLKVGDILFVRLMKSSRGGKVQFYQEDALVGEIDTKIEKPEKVRIKLSGYKKVPDKFFDYDKADFQWVKVGKLISDQEVIIKTAGDLNIVNALVGVTEEEFIAMQNRVNELIHQSRVIYWDKLSNSEKENLFNPKSSNIKVSYERKAPTLYKIKIEGIKSPATLVFSETYDSLWEIKGGSDSYPVYSLINGFKIDKDGTYDIYFTPQKYVISGLILSVVVLVFLTILLKRSR